MWPYLIMFLISINFIYVSEMIEKKVTGRARIFVSYIFRIIGVLIPAVLAGMRGFQVGIDVKVYGNPVFQASTFYESLHTFFVNNPYFMSHYEKGYLILNFLISRFTSNIQIYYFIINLIFVTTVYIAIKLLDDRLDVTFSWALFLITTWLFSLNILRQSLAMGFVFLCISFILKNKKISSLLTGIVAVLFHDSALILLLIIPLIILLGRGEKISKRHRLIILILPFPLMFSLNFMIEYAKTIPKFARHLTSHSGNQLATSLFLVFISFLIPLINSFIKKNQLLIKKNISIFITFLVIGAIFAGMGGFNYVIFGRIAYYFNFSIFIGIPSIYYELRNEIHLSYRYYTIELLLIKFALILIAAINFYFVFYLNNYGNLFPYSTG